MELEDETKDSSEKLVFDFRSDLSNAKLQFWSVSIWHRIKNANGTFDFISYWWFLFIYHFLWSLFFNDSKYTLLLRIRCGLWKLLGWIFSEFYCKSSLVFSLWTTKARIPPISGIKWQSWYGSLKDRFGKNKGDEFLLRWYVNSHCLQP